LDAEEPVILRETRLGRVERESKEGVGRVMVDMRGRDGRQERGKGDVVVCCCSKGKWSWWGSGGGWEGFCEELPEVEGL
jgi:hypothetical protein